MTNTPGPASYRCQNPFGEQSGGFAYKCLISLSFPFIKVISTRSADMLDMLPHRFAARETTEDQMFAIEYLSLFVL